MIGALFICHRGRTLVHLWSDEAISWWENFFGTSRTVCVSNPSTSLRIALLWFFLIFVKCSTYKLMLYKIKNKVNQNSNPNEASAMMANTVSSGFCFF
jgi:hypothetical protein